jgi:hypothetical protein
MFDADHVKKNLPPPSAYAKVTKLRCMMPINHCIILASRPPHNLKVLLWLKSLSPCLEIRDANEEGKKSPSSPEVDRGVALDGSEVGKKP